jgi:hypothetical protein
MYLDSPLGKAEEAAVELHSHLELENLHVVTQAIDGVSRMDVTVLI